MTAAVTTGKWPSGLYPDMPACVAARRVLRRRLRAVVEHMRPAAEQADQDAEHVHQLRVATRRAAAAVRIFRDFCPQEPRRELRRALKYLRRAAARARQDDVHAAQFAAQPLPSTPAAPEAQALLLASIAESRRKAQRRIVVAVRRFPPDMISGLAARLTRGLRAWPRRRAADEASAARAYTLCELAARALPALIEPMRGAAPAALEDPVALHRLRVAGKALRYALEVFVDCLPPEARQEVYPRLEETQEQLGQLNDLHEMALRIGGLRKRGRDGKPRRGAGRLSREVLVELTARARALRSEHGRRHQAFVERWSAPEGRSFLGTLDRLCAALRDGRSATSTAGVPHAASGNGAAPAAAPVRVASRRIAAIDVGTNSVRLVVAETDPSVKFRIIEDIKDTTRLGSGLYESGRLDAASIAATCASLERMKRIADGHRVERMRAVGTSALREARNAEVLLRRARERCGLEIDVIDAEYEARLAFSSVVNAFNMERSRFATVDLGGGSAEVVISSNGLIDETYTLPLGGVRLTEMFADRQTPGEYRFAELVEAVDRIIAESIARPPRGLDLVVGTGGTFTTLARVSIRGGARPRGDGRFPFAVRGYELSRREVSRHVARLRRMPLAERQRVAGMSARRAEIIVAGLCIIERLMEFLEVDRLRIHDGGIRDGLLLEMIDEMGLDMARSADDAQRMLDCVRAYAARMRYERAHSEHVARLALRIFDQLAEQRPDAGGTWDRRELRDLLHAAAVLHDVGTRIRYRRHHRHSYDMIVHADLPLLSRREIEVVACIARYHRRRGPRAADAPFRRLGVEDQRVVAHLAGILRIADGLDRTHTQAIEDVRVHVRPDAVQFTAVADCEPLTDLRAARTKADLFEAAFRANTRIDWTARPTAARAERIAR